MPKAGALFCSLLSLFVAAAPLMAQEAPWIGRWRLDPGASTSADARTYSRVDLVIGTAETGLAVVYDLVGRRGGRTHLEWTGPPDGRDYAVQGLDDVMTNAYTITGERGYEIRIEIDGQPVATTRVSISGDGATLTAVTTAPGSDAVSTSVYRRR
jgi:hypothetical protein